MHLQFGSGEGAKNLSVTLGKHGLQADFDYLKRGEGTKADVYGDYSGGADATTSALRQFEREVATDLGKEDAGKGKLVLRWRLAAWGWSISNTHIAHQSSCPLASWPSPLC